MCKIVWFVRGRWSACGYNTVLAQACSLRFDLRYHGVLAL
jgi:hypothetical protein